MHCQNESLSIRIDSLFPRQGFPINRSYGRISTTVTGKKGEGPILTGKYGESINGFRVWSVRAAIAGVLGTLAALHRRSKAVRDGPGHNNAKFSSPLASPSYPAGGRRAQATVIFSDPRPHAGSRFHRAF